MVARFSGCNPNRLRLLLEDQLSEGAQLALAKHLESCPGCRLRLESLAAEADWWSDARQFRGSQPTPDSPRPP